MNPYGRQSQPSYSQPDTAWRDKPEQQDEWGPLQQAIAGGDTKVSYPEQGQQPQPQGPWVNHVADPGKIQGPAQASAAQGGVGGYTPNYGGVAPAGWDQTKWNDPTHQSVKYQAGHWMQQNADNGMMTKDTIGGLVNYLRGQGYQVGDYGGGDTINLLGGNELVGPAEIDVAQGFGDDGRGVPQWLNNTYPGTPAQPQQSSLYSAISPSFLSQGAQGVSRGASYDLLSQILGQLQASGAAYRG